MAPKLYAAQGGVSTTSDLYTVDAPSGAVLSDIGPIGFAITGLAFDPTDGTLYAVTSNRSAVSPHSLIRIDALTGAGTFIGDFGSSGNSVNDISFDATGTLYGTRQDGKLVTISKATAAQTVIGTIRTSAIVGGGTAFLSTGILYVTPDNTLHLDRIIVSPFSVTPISLTGVAKDIGAMSADASDVLYAVSPADSKFYTVNAATGVATLIGVIPLDFVDGLAWSPAEAPSGCSLAVSPAAVSASQGGSATSTVTSSLLGGPDSTVTLTATGLPTGVTAAFSANPIDENGGASTVTFSASLTAPLGTTTVTIHGIDGNGNICTKPITVTVIAFVPVPGGGFSVRERVPFN